MKERPPLSAQPSTHRGIGRWRDPRYLSVVGTLLALGAVVSLASALVTTSNRARASVEEVEVQIDAPLLRLQDTLDASSSGETQLQLAAATVGPERTRHLQASIAAGETAAKSWTRYQTVALPLANEPLLAARYERDYAAGKEAAADAIVPILNADRPAPLAPQQIAAAERNVANLRALRTRYHEARAATLRGLDDDLEAAGRRTRIGAAGCLALIALLGLGTVRSAGRTVRSRRIREQTVELAAFESQLVRGLELLEHDDQAFATAGRALAVASPTSTHGISATDHDGTAMRTAAGSMVCGIESTGSCPAVRAGAPLQFPDSAALDACPHLVGAPRCSATCLPISIAGRSAAVVQLVGDVRTPPEADGAVQVVVRRLGERITIMRAIARFEQQASRDPLTGLINRRSLEAAVADLRSSGTEFAVAFADLDHFKRVNDDFGHQAGDRALCAFASNVVASLRGVDLACRWGGEEFVMVLPGCDERAATEAMERVRALLVLDGLQESMPPVTVSIGIAVVHAGETFADTLGRADAALNSAKSTGRNRVVVWAPAEASSPRPSGRAAST